MLQICSTENPEVFLNFFDFLVTFVLLCVFCVHLKYSTNHIQNRWHHLKRRWQFPG